MDSDLGYTTCVVEKSDKSRNDVENGNYLRIGMGCFLKRYAMWKVLCGKSFFMNKGVKVEEGHLLRCKESR